MKLIDIENLSVDELKKRRDELAKTIVASMIDQLDPESGKVITPADILADELAARYVRTLVDAKVRDQTLGEQGKTITNLNAALDAANELSAKSSAATTVANEQAASAKSELAKAILQIDSLNGDIAAEKKRSERYRGLAGQHLAAVNTAWKALNDSIGAQALADADNG